MAVAGSNSLLWVRKGEKCQQGSKNAEARNLVNGEGKKLNKKKLTVAACYRQFACGG